MKITFEFDEMEDAYLCFKAQDLMDLVREYGNILHRLWKYEHDKDWEVYNEWVSCLQDHGVELT